QRDRAQGGFQDRVALDGRLPARARDDTWSLPAAPVCGVEPPRLELSSSSATLRISKLRNWSFRSKRLGLELPLRRIAATTLLVASRRRASLLLYPGRVVRMAGGVASSAERRAPRGSE